MTAIEKRRLNALRQKIYAGMQLTQSERGELDALRRLEIRELARRV